MLLWWVLNKRNSFTREISTSGITVLVTINLKNLIQISARPRSTSSQLWIQLLELHNYPVLMSNIWQLRQQYWSIKSYGNLNSSVNKFKTEAVSYKAPFKHTNIEIYYFFNVVGKIKFVLWYRALGLETYKS